MNISKILSEQKPCILDVRTPAEFSGGHVTGSINIPLQELQQRMAELKKLNQPFVICCASGMRSSQACNFLSQFDFNCINGGSWMDVNYAQTLNQN